MTTAAAAAPVVMGDWSDPGPAGVYTGVQAGAFYVGGNTPHVWSLAQVRRQTCRYMLPIWVYFAGRGGPEGGDADGRAALAACRSYGMTRGRVAVDMETAVDYGYTKAFRDVIAREPGWWTVVYGSASTVERNYCPGGGWWVADWVGRPYEYPGAHVWATQCEDAAQAGRPWDLSELTTTSHLWEANPPAPPPAIKQHGLLLKGVGLGSPIKDAAAAGLTYVTSADGKTWT